MASRALSRSGIGMLPMLVLFALLLVSLWLMSSATHNSCLLYTSPSPRDHG